MASSMFKRTICHRSALTLFTMTCHKVSDEKLRFETFLRKVSGKLLQNIGVLI